MDITKCPHYEKTSYHKCKKYKKLGLNCDCLSNDINTGLHNSKLCFFREEYYKKYPYKYIQFGKYKYYEYKEIPDSYIAWLLKQNIGKDLREIIENMILEKYRKGFIDGFIQDNYKPYKSHLYKYASSSTFNKLSKIPMDMDYCGDLFDAMQGCGLNGD